MKTRNSAAPTAPGAQLTVESRDHPILDVLAVPVYTTDAQGHLVYYNEAAAALWGCRPELGKAEWCGSWKLYYTDGRPMPHDECPMALTIKQASAVRGGRAIAERPDGTRVLFAAFPEPLFDTSGALVGAVNMLVDITEREGLAQHLAAIVESSDDAIVSKDLNGVIQSWNKGAERLFGYTADEAVGKSVTILIPTERADEEPGILARLRRGERVDHYETVRRRKDGTTVDISLTISPIKDSASKVIGASKIARDITERRRAHEQQALLFNEMKHRVKNTLATAQAIASQSIRTASAEDRAEFNARLQALARAHDLLTLENWSRAPLADIVNIALSPFREKHSTRFSIGGAQGLWLEANKAALLAMGLHELATNAAKHGALSNDDGMVHVTWEPTRAAANGSGSGAVNGNGNGKGSNRVRLQWRESGGPPVVSPERKGFGSLLIERALNNELGGAKIEFAPDGVCCTLEIEL